MIHFANLLISDCRLKAAPVYALGHTHKLVHEHQSIELNNE